MPVSRIEHIDKIFAILELSDCDKANTNLLTIVDGGPELFVKTRNLTENSKFAERLCIQFPQKTKKSNYSTFHRKFRITEIHNIIKQHIWACDYIIGIEDDTVPPTNFIKKLLKDYSDYPYAGFIEGVEVARWGIPYIGGWLVDNVYEPTVIKSVMPDKGIKEIDAGGFYCFITTRDNYVTHNFDVFDRGSMGPDVNFGIELRKQGQLNYIDWSIQCEHVNGDRAFKITNQEISECSMIKNDKGIWRQKIHITLP